MMRTFLVLLIGVSALFVVDATDWALPMEAWLAERMASALRCVFVGVGADPALMGTVAPACAGVRTATAGAILGACLAARRKWLGAAVGALCGLGLNFVRLVAIEAALRVPRRRHDAPRPRPLRHRPPRRPRRLGPLAPLLQACPRHPRRVRALPRHPPPRRRHPRPERGDHRGPQRSPQRRTEHRMDGIAPGRERRPHKLLPRPRPSPRRGALFSVAVEGLSLRACTLRSLFSKRRSRFPFPPRRGHSRRGSGSFPTPVSR